MRASYLKIEVLTPVHIGTGDQIDPMGYLLRREEKEIFCYLVDTKAWASDYPDSEALSRVFSDNNLARIRGFMTENLDPATYSVRRLRVSNSAIYAEYETKLRDQGSPHQLLIDPQLGTGLGLPLLPGSSIKGAIRTAVIDHLDRTRQLDLKGATKAGDKRAYDKRLESVLGKITDSAFKQLKLSDFEGWADSTLLVTATEVRRKEGKSTTPKSHAEVLASQHLGRGDHITLCGKLVIGYGQAHTSSAACLRLADGESWDWNGLADLVNRYQRQRLVKEKERFYNLPQFAGGRAVVDSVLQVLENAGPGEMILRLGHYSQIEYVTVENNAPFTRKGKDGKFLPHGTTRTLANGSLPFGWIKISPCGEETYWQIQRERQAHNELIFARREQQRQAIRLAKKEEEAQRLERERLEAERRAAEARRQAELDAMPAEERQLFLLERGELQEHEVVALFNSLGSMGPELQQHTATALKAFWQKEGKWSKKECSKKQWEKVQQLKGYLGEA